MRYRTLYFYVSILDTYNVRIDMSAQQYNSSHYCMGLFSEHTFGLLPSDQMLLKCESYNIHVFRSLSIRIKIFFMFVIFKSSSPISLKPIYLFFSQNPFKGICFNLSDVPFNANKSGLNFSIVKISLRFQIWSHGFQKIAQLT